MNSLVARISLVLAICSLIFIFWVDLFSAEWYISLFSLAINVMVCIYAFKKVYEENKHDK